MRPGIPIKILFLASCLCCSSCLPKKEPAGFRIALIPEKTTTPFWEAVYGGALKAEKELEARGMDVDIHWRGPTTRPDATYQAQLLNNFVSNRISGIIVAPSDAQKLAAPVANAMDADIPVMVINSEVGTQNYVGLVKTGHMKAGKLAAEHLLKLTKRKGTFADGTFAVLGSESPTASEQARDQGAREALSGVDDISVLPKTTDDVAPQLAAGDIDAVFCLTREVTEATVKALRNAGFSGGRVMVVGWGASESAVSHLRVGDIQALLVEDPLQMGYLGVLGIVAHLSGNSPDKEVDTGAFLVTKESMPNKRIKDLLNPPVEELLKGAR